TWIGEAIRIKWRHCSDGVYLMAVGRAGPIRVWKLRMEQDTYSLQLLWGMGLNQLVLADTKLDDIVGLSPLNQELMEQRVADSASRKLASEETDESSGESIDETPERLHGEGTEKE
ncbi:hypothetical protein BGX23_010409, partial [Mortierella sp. AD031]